jgi:uncharacterized protein YcaQ
MTDLPLFAVPPMHRTTDPETSRAAAAAVTRRLSDLHGRVLAAVAAVGAVGVTGAELERQPGFADCAPSTVRKRLSELNKMGRLAAAGRRDGMTVYMLAAAQGVAA